MASREKISCVSVLFVTPILLSDKSDCPEGVFVLLNGFPHGFKQIPCILGICNDPCIELRTISFIMVDLPKIDHEFTDVVAYPEAIRIAAFDS